MTAKIPCRKTPQVCNIFCTNLILNDRLRVGVLVRALIIPLGVFAISISASAMPLSGVIAPPSSVAVRVDDTDDNFPHWRSQKTAPEPPRPRPEDCRLKGLQYRHGECVPPERKVTPTPRPAAAKAKPARSTPPADKQLAEKLARALSEQERAVQASKPLILPASRVVATAAKADARKSVALRPMVGQLLLSGFAGKRPADAGVAGVSNQLRNGLLSGVIVSDANISSFRQLRQMLLTLAKDSGDSFPLVAIEQPGGPDSVLSEDKGFTFYASANEISNDRNPYEAQLFYRGMAAELSSLGVNLNIGPSADVCRDEGVDLSASCFGTAASSVAAFATAFNFGHHDRGVLTALRHMPFRLGVQPSWKTERASTAILRGLAKAEPSDALVIRVKAMEPSPLADMMPEPMMQHSASKLHRAYGFQGAIIFDLDLGVSGAPVRYREAIVRAFQAGADIVLVRDASDLPADLASIGYEAVETGLKSGNLQMARIEDAYRHVQQLKDRLRGLQSRTHTAEVFEQ